LHQTAARRARGIVSQAPDFYIKGVARAQQKLFQVEHSIRALQDTDRASRGGAKMRTSSEYGGMGILEAVDKLFNEEGDGKTTAEIAAIIRDRGGSASRRAS
jgi:hypothetical protein